MHGLTYGVIRVDSEEKLSVLTVQDVGLVMPGGEKLPLKLRMIHQFNWQQKVAGEHALLLGLQAPRKYFSPKALPYKTSWFGNPKISCLHLAQCLSVLALAACIK